MEASLWGLVTNRLRCHWGLSARLLSCHWGLSAKPDVLLVEVVLVSQRGVCVLDLLQNSTEAVQGESGDIVPVDEQRCHPVAEGGVP